MRKEQVRKTIIRTLGALLAALTLLLAACTGAPSVRTGSNSGKGSLESPSDTPSGTPATPEPTPSGETTVTPTDGEEPYESDPALQLTELMVNNLHCVKDIDGSYLPWIELWNRSDSAVRFSDYALDLDGRKISMPAVTLEADGYYLLFVPGLTASGKLTLRHGDKIADEVRYLNETPDCSFLTEHGGETSTPTPGYKNVRAADALRISEVAPKNSIYPVDGLTGAFIELHNAGERDVDLGDYFLSQNQSDRYIAKLPAITLKAGEYLALPCAGELHFSLSTFASALYLTRSDGVLAASVEYPDAEKNRSFADGAWQLPSPGYPNTEAGRMAYAAGRKGLIINEVMASNTRYNEVDGEFYDLIELKNATDGDLKLSDYYISDGQKNLKKYRLPDVTLRPGALYVLPCTGYEGKYCPFKISSDGEMLIVSNEEGKISDALECPHIPTDRSWGRSGGEFVYFETPTPGGENGTGYTSISQKPTATAESGFYTETFEVKLQGEGTVYYTLDGSHPTAKSKKYNGESIRIEKNTTLRAVCVDGKKIESGTVTWNYFINAIDLTLPVVKMTVVYDEFYGEDGIFTKNISTLQRDTREIEGHVAMYVDGKEEFTVNCGVKVQGNYSRKYPKKSYQLKFRAKYGDSKLKYDIFGDGELCEFDSLVLRSGSEDYYVTMMRDEVVTSAVLAYAKEVLAQRYRPVNLYINDEYIGVYYIRDKINEDFVATRWNVDPATVTILQSLEYVERGPYGDWYSYLRRYIANTDFTVKENYDYICTRFNIESLIDYYIFYTWADNRDHGNTRLCRSDDYDGGRWHFIFYDSDMAFGMYAQNKNDSTADFLFGTLQSGDSSFHNTLVYKLFKNATFRDLFLKRLEELCSEAYTDGKASGYIEHIRALIDHDMQYIRFGTTYDKWKNTHMPRLQNYVLGRADKLREEFAVLFKLSESEQIKYFGKKVT